MQQAIICPECNQPTSWFEDTRISMNIRNPFVECDKCGNVLMVSGYNEWEAASPKWKLGFAMWLFYPFLIYVMFGAGIVGLFAGSLKGYFGSDNVTAIGVLIGGTLGGILKLLDFHWDVKQSRRRMKDEMLIARFAQAGIIVERGSEFSHFSWVLGQIGLLVLFVAFLIYLILAEISG